MAIIVQNGVSPESKNCAAEAIYEGKLYKYDTSGNLTVITAKGDAAAAVAVASSYETDGTAKTMTAGEGHPFVMINSNVIVQCYSGITETYSVGAAVYLHDSVDGAVTTSNSSSVCIGTYEGMDGLVTTAAGDLVAVRLDRSPSAAA